jgi:hypothetical protein
MIGLLRQPQDRRTARRVAFLAHRSAAADALPGGCHGGLEPRTKGAPVGQGEPAGRQRSYCQVAATLPASWRLPPMRGWSHAVHVRTREDPRRNSPSVFIPRGANGLSSSMVGPSVAPVGVDKEVLGHVANPEVDVGQRQPGSSPLELGLSRETHVAATEVDPTLEASAASLGPRSGADAGSEKESLVSEDKSQPEPEPELEPDRLVINKLGSPADEFFVVSLGST